MTATEPETRPSTSAAEMDASREDWKYSDFYEGDDRNNHSPRQNAPQAAGNRPGEAAAPEDVPAPRVTTVDTSPWL